MYIYGFFAGIAVFLAFWAIVFIGRYPMGLFDVERGFMQYQYQVYSYFPLFLTNSWMSDESHTVEVEIDYPDSYSRLVLVCIKVPSVLLNIAFHSRGICLSSHVPSRRSGVVGYLGDW